MEILYKHSERVHNLKAPSQVVPILIDLFKPESILDVGCGTGTWLKVFKDSGVSNIYGIDGANVNPDQLLISESEFIEKDLREQFSLGKTFDLVLSLEVAEHLPEAVSTIFVESLCRHGVTILFSAAIPRQGGQNHLNEQWPEYWAAKFKQFGFTGYDIVRPLIWNSEDVFYWYKQNMIVFSKKDLSQNVQPVRGVRSYVHPVQFEEKIKELKWQMQDIKNSQPKGVRQLLKATIKAVIVKVSK